jgi:hypothetical protein
MQLTAQLTDDSLSTMRKIYRGRRSRYRDGMVVSGYRGSSSAAHTHNGPARHHSLMFYAPVGVPIAG